MLIKNMYICNNFNHNIRISTGKLSTHFQTDLPCLIWALHTSHTKSLCRSISCFTNSGDLSNIVTINQFIFSLLKNIEINHLEKTYISILQFNIDHVANANLLSTRAHSSYVNKNTGLTYRRHPAFSCSHQPQIESRLWILGLLPSYRFLLFC